MLELALIYLWITFFAFQSKVRLVFTIILIISEFRPVIALSLLNRSYQYLFDNYEFSRSLGSTEIYLCSDCVCVYIGVCASKEIGKSHLIELSWWGTFIGFVLWLENANTERALSIMMRSWARWCKDFGWSWLKSKSPIQFLVTVFYLIGKLIIGVCWLHFGLWSVMSVVLSDPMYL